MIAAVLALCGLGRLPTAAGAAARSAPAAARVPRDRMAPPVLFAQVVVPAAPLVAVQPVPGVIAQGNVVRVVTPVSSQPGVLWLITIGAILCRFGARVLRVT